MDEFPRPGESVGADDFIMRCAGKGANQAVAAARLGAKVQLIAKVGENCIATVLGANLELDKTSAKKYESALKGASLVLIQAEVSPLGNKKIFKLAKKHGVKTFFNASPGDPDMDMSNVELTDILCCPWIVAAEFVTGIPQESFEDAKNAAAQMLTMGPEHVIITLGAKGKKFEVQISAVFTDSGTFTNVE
ncbi:hypothetical protein Aduo_005725 [Ancylostoma duodenale]